MDERHKAIDTVIKNMEKSFGKGAVMKLGDDAGRKVKTTSSGSVTLDRALGVGGYPQGRIIEVYRSRHPLQLDQLLLPLRDHR